MSQKYVFLDFDGVMNCSKTWGFRGDDPASALEEVLVKRVSDFCEAIDAKIVISSSWGVGYSLDELKQFLKSKSFTNVERIIGITPKKFSNDNRGNEIRWWLEAKGISDNNCVILDDMNPEEFWRMEHRLIQTDNSVGITEDDIRNALKLLKDSNEKA